MSQPGVQQRLPPPAPAPRPQPKHDDPKRAEKERQRRKDEERKRLEKQKSAEKQKELEKAKEKEKNRAAQQSNPASRLKRETPFICNIRFKNDLPEIPCDPKMLVEPLDPIKQSEFFITTLERDPRRDLILAPDLGIPIGLLNVERYQIPDDVPPLDPLDAALLGEPESIGRSGHKGAEHPWLLKTTYISNDFNELKNRTIAAEKERVTAEELSPDATIELTIRNIVASFEASRRPPKHAKNPSLRAVEVLPVLPDPEGWAFQHALTSFDNDPMDELPQLADLAPRLKRAKMERSVLAAKRTQAGPNGEEPQRFMALCLPRHVELPEEEEAHLHDIPASELEGEYDWSKEYAYEMISAELEELQRNYLVRFKDHQAVYTDLATRLTLKRKKLGQSTIHKPVKVNVLSRMPTVPEEVERNRRLQLLNEHGEEQDAEDADDY